MTWEYPVGHAPVVLDQYPAEHFHNVTTSPPYWGLRDYSIMKEHRLKRDAIEWARVYAEEMTLRYGDLGSIYIPKPPEKRDGAWIGKVSIVAVWGGKPSCDHQWGEELPHGRRGKKGISGDGGYIHPTLRDARQGGGSGGGGAYCRGCNAWLGSYGLEPTPELYVEHTLEILRAIRRVLRPDGTVWWNLGDSYNAMRGNGWEQEGWGPADSHGTEKRPRPEGLKQKDLVLLPFRVALAAQADGWWVRSTIIWSKSNAMPESAQDRPTTSHEYVFLLTKAPRYYYDAVAIREEGKKPYNVKNPGGWNSSLGEHHGTIHPEGRTKTTTTDEVRTGRNARTVWEITPKPFKEAHFATFPPKLVERCIMAGTSEYGCCASCGAPYVRRIEKTGTKEHKRKQGTQGEWTGSGKGGRVGGMNDGTHPEGVVVTTIGWEAGCDCKVDVVPCRVLDPFVGSGTTLDTARQLGRHAVGVDISEEYRDIWRRARPLADVADITTYGGGP